MDIRKVMEAETEKLLLSMEADGFTLMRCIRERSKGKPPLYEFIPAKATTWDINNGWCEEWAENVADSLGDGEPVWLDGLEDYDLVDAGAHCALLLRGRWYDAECHEGVDDWHKLPFVTNANKTREEVLSERASKASRRECTSQART